MISSMKVFVPLALALFAIVTPAHAQGNSCRVAYRRCNFRFRTYPFLPTFDIDVKADKSFTSRIISKNPRVRIGVLNTNITPRFIFKSGRSMITNFGSPHFTPSHFKPFPINPTKGSGVGHQTFHGNQMMVAKNRCVIMYFSHYQVLGMKGRVIKNENNVPRYRNMCVVFRTK